MNVYEVILLFIFGALGALIRLLSRQGGKLELPYLRNGQLYLGFLGSLIIGAGVGFVVDGSLITAFLAGYTGSSLLSKLVFNGQDKYYLKK